jgi:hypothetical protein
MKLLNIKSRKMVLRKVCLTITLFYIITMFCSSIFAEEVSTQNKSIDSNKPNDEVITSFELVNKWKATLFSRTLKKINERVDGTHIDMLYYVEVKLTDSNTIHKVWECLFPEIPGLGQIRPYEFVFGPAEDDKFCLSFVMYHPVNSLCYFVLDPNKEIDIDDYKTADENSTIMRLINHDPNITIPLSNIFGLYKNSEVLVRIEKMNSVCFDENTAIFNFSSVENEFIFRYSIVNNKPIYSAYKINGIEVTQEDKGK